jgi:hypothetical protein
MAEGQGFGAQAMEGLASGLGAAGGGILQTIIGQLFAGRNQRRQDESASRQSNLNTLNDYLTKIAETKAFSPSDPFVEMMRGRARAAESEQGGRVGFDGGYSGNAEGSAARDAGGPSTDPAMMNIVAALRNPETYSMRERPGGGGYTFDPQAINPLELAHASGTSRAGGYQLGGETQYFGRNQGAPGGPPQPPQQPQNPRRPDDERNQYG